MDSITEIRYCHFMAGVLVQQQGDPFCANCKAFTNTVLSLRERLKLFDERRASLGTLPEQQTQLLIAAARALSGVSPDPNAVGQKKAGNCGLPQGVCFVKSSKALGSGPV